MPLGKIVIANSIAQAHNINDHRKWGHDRSIFYVPVYGSQIK